jgi:magnesium chelatase family protein
MVDRIDLHVDVPRMTVEKLSEDGAAIESSADVRMRVEAARERQRIRFEGEGIYANAEMSSRQASIWCQLKPASITLLRQAVARLKLSTRSYFRVLKISRTIADLAGTEIITESQVAEALRYRPAID